MAARRPDNPPGKTPEAAENHLISMAYDLVERQIADGSVSAQVLAHLVKQGSPTHKKVVEKLENENILLKAKVEQMANSGHQEEMYERALRAFTVYAGESDEDVEI